MNEHLYLDLLDYVKEEGKERKTRNSITKSIFGESVRYSNITEDFPLLTTKKMNYKSIFGELCGFIQGCTHEEEFSDLGCNVWRGNATDPAWMSKIGVEESGWLGKIYGHQWRAWGGEIDQLGNLIKGMIKDPFGRRHVVSAWNPEDLNLMCLPPCHMFFQCYVNEDNTFDLQMYQRSCDMFLGVPFNIASYSALMLVIGSLTGFSPGDFIHSMGDIHIYENQYEAVEEQLRRGPLPPPEVSFWYDLVNKENPLWDKLNHIQPHMFTVNNYEHHPAIKVDMVV